MRIAPHKADVYGVAGLLLLFILAYTYLSVKNGSWDKPFLICCNLLIIIPVFVLCITIVLVNGKEIKINRDNIEIRFWGYYRQYTWDKVLTRQVRHDRGKVFSGQIFDEAFYISVKNDASALSAAEIKMNLVAHPFTCFRIELIPDGFNIWSMYIPPMFYADRGKFLTFLAACEIEFEA